MGLLDWIRGSRAKGADPSSAQGGPVSVMHSQMQTQPGATSASNRREMLRLVLRDTLNRHGIPATWIGAEALNVTSRQREPGLHWRLVIKQWDARLLPHLVSFQHSLIKRVTAFDPMASSWLMGMSWQFQIDDESVCPEMPHAGFWTSDPPKPAVDPAAPVATGDVIAGPVLIGPKELPSGEASARAYLDKLFAIRDAHLLEHAQSGDKPSFDATQPLSLPR